MAGERTRCAGCGRPPLVCLCAALVMRTPHTKVVVVQHPRERDNAIGTAWMVERCLGAERIVGVELDDDPALDRALSDPEAPAILLAPGPDAIDLAAAPPPGPVTLVVVDGTWAQARKLLRVNRRLRALPRYAFAPAQPSQYRIRREPAEHCVSTIEATVAALEHLEPLRGGGSVADVLQGFHAMVDHQVRIAHERAESRHLHTAIARAARRPPRVKRPPLEGGVVVAYGEANAYPHDDPRSNSPEIVHFVAERVPARASATERFEAYVTPSLPLSPGFVAHTALDPARVLGGESRASFHARLTAFLRPDERLAVWGFHAVEVLLGEGLPLPPRVDLRSTALRYLGRRAGDVDGVAAALGCVVEPPWAAGRTGLRLAAAVGVARALMPEGG